MAKASYDRCLSITIDASNKQQQKFLCSFLYPICATFAFAVTLKFLKIFIIYELINTRLRSNIKFFYSRAHWPKVS